MKMNNKKIPQMELGVAIASLVFIVILLINTSEYRNEIASLEDKVNNIGEEYNQTIEKMANDCQEKIKKMSAIDYNPTLQEVKEVVYSSNVNRKEYHEDLYNCYDYSVELVKDFREAKIYSCISILYFVDGAHANVAINTSDYGLIYVEPQDDKIIYNLNSGDDYCETVNWYCDEDWTIEYIKNCFESDPFVIKYISITEK